MPIAKAVFRRIKNVATIGSSNASRAVLLDLMKAGMVGITMSSPVSNPGDHQPTQRQSPGDRAFLRGSLITNV